MKPTPVSPAPRNIGLIRLGCFVGGIVALLILLSIALSSSPFGSSGPAATPVTANAQWTPRTQAFNGVDMVFVPAGCFMMGSDDNPNEKPVTKVCFDKPFWIDKTDVTQAQFKRLGGVAAHPSYFTGDNRPVDSITWLEANYYCISNRSARLPTEAEWEYAARGPDNLLYPWGNTLVPDNVVYPGNANSQTADVGSKPGGASWVGALDMSGNVSQWVSTIFRPYPYNAFDGRESLGDTTENRTLRGGSWFQMYGLRAPDRSPNGPSVSSFYNGFRCARSS